MMKRARIITIANQKGGTGKTTTTFNLGNALMAQGKRVLLVDFDPQANLTRCCGIDNPDGIDTPLSDVINLVLDSSETVNVHDYTREGKGLHILPSNINLSVTEVNLRNEMGGDQILPEILDPLREDYDYILIDTSPYLGILTINALAACDSVIIPVNPELWSATGLTDLIKSILLAKKRINKRIQIEGVLLTMCDERTLLFREAVQLLEDTFGDQVKIFQSRIPRSTKVGRANFYSTSIFDFDVKNAAAASYLAFAKEVMGI